MAGAATAGWQVGGGSISPRMARLALLWHGRTAAPRPPPIQVAGLPQDRRPDRLRLLLGLLPAVPARLRLRFRGGTPGALLLDGLRQPAPQARERHGLLEWDAPVHLAADRPLVLGLALPPGGMTIEGLELLP